MREQSARLWDLYDDVFNQMEGSGFNALQSTLHFVAIEMEGALHLVMSQ